MSDTPSIFSKRMGQRGSKTHRKRNVGELEDMIASFGPVQEVDIDTLEDAGHEEYKFDWKRSDALMRNHNTRGLSQDVIEHILSYLLPVDLIATGGTCKSWRRISSEDRVWAVFGCTKTEWLIASGTPLKNYVPEELQAVTVVEGHDIPISACAPLTASAKGTTGTSSLVLRFFGGTFNAGITVRHMDSYRRKFTVDDISVTLSVLDMQVDEYDPGHHMRNKFMALSECLLLCSPLRTKEQLKEIDVLYKEIALACGVDRMPIVLVQTRRDDMGTLGDSHVIDTKRQMLRYSTVKSWIDAHQRAVFISTSARTGEGVDLAFAWAARLSQFVPKNRRRYGD